MNEPIALTMGSRWKATNQEVIALAQMAEQLGYDSLWVGESWGRDAFTLLTLVSCHTRKIRLGTGIATVYARTPTMTAQSIASLDVASGGRAILGLGTSGQVVIEQWHGVEFGSPVERTREYIEIVRLILSGQVANYDGRIFKLQRFRLAFSPVQQQIPIYVAALGSRNLGLTAELANGWLPIWLDPEGLARMKLQVEDHAQKAGRSINDVEVAPQILAYASINDDQKAEGERLMRRHMAYYVGGMGRYHYELFQRLGFEREVQHVKNAWSQNERELAASLITQEMLDEITISGDPDRCREQLFRFREAGADMPIIAFPNDTSLEVAMSTLRVLAPQTT
jgi:F420-dependent oxidoreductase-like protein